MTIPQKRELRGFDSYELRLGDELRGERACLGKSLFDVQRDLRIKACYIDAIENSDPSAIENQSFVAGYIRSYARYLKLNPEEVYERFCQESGFVPARQRIPQQSITGATSRRAAEDPFGDSELAAVLNGRAGLEIGPMISAAVSLVAVAALVGGIGYGGWTFLKNIQQVSSAPPAAELAAVSLTEITRRSEMGAAIDPSVYEDDGVLAQLYRNDDASALGFSPADGPIAAIDPTTAGVFAPVVQPTASEVLAKSLGANAPVDASIANSTPTGPIPLAYAHAAQSGLVAVPATVPTATAMMGVSIHATHEAWVRIDSSNAGVIFSGLMSPGESFKLPETVSNAILKVGNAGGVIIMVDGEAFGPIGASGVVQSGIILDPEVVRASYPRASDVGAQAAEGGAIAVAERNG